MKKLTKYIAFGISMLSFVGSARADIEPINTVVQYAVAVPAQIQKQYQDVADVVSKAKNLYLMGRDKVNEIKKKIEDIKEDPLGVLKTGVMEGLKNKGGGQDGGEVEIEAERADRVKEVYNRGFGMIDNIAVQKELNKQVNKEKLKNAAVLFARSLLKRQELREEETEEPSLETVALAQKASNDINLRSFKRWNTILETQAYITSGKYLVKVQNYINESPVEEGEE